MAGAALSTICCVGTKQCHGGQPVHESAGEQHHQFIEQQQQLKLNDLQRQRSGVCGTTGSNGPSLHWLRCGQLFNWAVRRSNFKRHWDRWRNLQEGRTMRIAEVIQDAQRLWPQGGGSCCLVPRFKGVSGYGNGGNAMPVPWCNRQASHSLVATKS